MRPSVRSDNREKSLTISYLFALNGGAWETMSREQKDWEWRRLMSLRAALNKRTWCSPWER